MSDEFASKAAQDKAVELGIDAEDIQGTGQEGRIRVEDVERVASESGKAGGAAKFVKHDTPGEYVVSEIDEEGNASRAVVIPSATVVPLTKSEYDKLPKDENGELVHPLVETKKGE